MKCDKKCFECQFDDCIVGNERMTKEQHRTYQARWREKNRARVRENQRNYRRAHADDINARVRNRNLLSKKCEYCKADLRGRTTVQKCGNGYFCTNECLSEYLLQKTIEKGKVKTIIMPRTEGGE